MSNRISRGSFIRNAGLGLGAALALGAGKPRKARANVDGPANGRPNILVMLVDDQSIRSPWAQQSMTNFFNFGGCDLTDGCYGESALCAPSRTSFLTGKYEHVHGTFGNEDSYIRYRRNGWAENDLLGKLDRNGYRVGFFGKFLNNYDDSPEFPNGSRWSHPHVDRWSAIVGGQNDGLPWRVNNDGVVSDQTGDHTVYFGDKAETFIRNQQGSGSAWYCEFAPTDPHSPYNPPPVDEHTHDGATLNNPATQESDFSDKSDKYFPALDRDPAGYHQHTYEGELEEGEQNERYFGKLVQALRDTGQLDNTLIFYVSDNGYMHGEHGGLGTKQKPYEESIRVPLLVRGPGIPTHGAVDNAWGTETPLVSRLDVPFTILSAAGIPTTTPDGEGFQGRDLRNLDNGPAGWRKRVFAEMGPNTTTSSNWTLVREGSRKLVKIHRTGEYELYHLDTDPWENNSLAKDPAYATEITELENRIATFRTARSSDLIKASEVA